MSGGVYMALDRLADENPECERGRDFLARRASQFTGLVTTEDLRRRSRRWTVTNRQYTCPKCGEEYYHLPGHMRVCDGEGV